MLTIRQISRNCFHTIAMFFAAGALTLIGMALIGLILAAFGGDR